MAKITVTDVIKIINEYCMDKEEQQFEFLTASYEAKGGSLGLSKISVAISGVGSVEMISKRLMASELSVAPPTFTSFIFPA